MAFRCNMFTVLFAIGRLPGWIAHWLEMHPARAKKICRPRQIYRGQRSAILCRSRIAVEPMSEVVAVRQGAIILCGGSSSHMGRDKAWLPFGPQEVMLQRVVRLVREVVPVENIVCVAAADQGLPELPHGVEIIHDPVPYCGPLAGLATGLAALGDRADAVFTAGCDVPLLVPAFARRMFELLGDHEAVVAQDEDREPSPFRPCIEQACYNRRINSWPKARRSLMSLLERCDAWKVPIERLTDVDPTLSSLFNCNTLDEYERALRTAGISVG